MNVKNTVSVIIISILSLATLLGQGIKGKIFNENGDPIAYATIYAKNINNGTTSNNLGEYSLKLPKGECNLSVRYLGLKPEEIKINVTDNWTTKDIVLTPHVFEIQAIIVTNKSEDPANLIMRRAIGMSNFYKNLVKKYTAQVYIKGGSELKKVPRILRKQIPIDTGKVSVLESLSEITFELPNKITETVISMRSSEENMEGNPMRYANINIYNIESLGVISPLNPNAFTYYKFELLGTYKEFDRSINKIRFTPKRKGQDLVSGTLHISEDFWNINNAEIVFQTPFGDIEIKELYNPIQDYVWMPITKNISFKGGLMGIKVEFNYVASINKYKIELNPDINHNYLNQIAKVNNYITTKEESKTEAKIDKPTSNKKIAKDQKEIEELLTKENLTNKDLKRIYRKMEKSSAKEKVEKPLEIKDNLKILPSAKNQSQEFWDSVTTVKLNKKELRSYSVRDSLVEAHSKPEYKDSIQRVKKKLTFKALIIGKSFYYNNDSTILNYSGLINPMDGYWFNCVDGLVYSNKISFSKQYANAKYFSAEVTPSFAFGREAFMINSSFAYKYDPLQRSSISFLAGSESKDYSQFGVDKIVNTFSSLWYKENYTRIYRDNYIAAQHKTDLINGLEFTVGLKYSDRKTLNNTTNFSFTNRDDVYQPNTLENNNGDTYSPENNSAFIVNTYLEYTPRYRFRYYKGRKIMVNSKYPTFFGSANWAIPNVLNTDNNYLKATFGVKQELGLGFLSSLKYQVMFGTFVTSKKVGFQDYFHLPSSFAPFYMKAEFNTFALLPYYKFSHTNTFINAKIDYNCNRFLVKRLPFINNTLISENFGVNYYSTKNLNNYVEVSYGLHNILMVINADVYVGLNDFDYSGVGFRLGFKIF